jgi:hypothetical protein
MKVGNGLDYTSWLAVDDVRMAFQRSRAILLQWISGHPALHTGTMTMLMTLS